ncbi:MAG: glycoside hydrolase family 55 protein [Oligoflexia bacterium]|nr:glycoside hydrolase family 55 protein [Oligoflexia bacterium]
MSYKVNLLLVIIALTGSVAGLASGPKSTHTPRYPNNQILPENLWISPVGDGITDDTLALQTAINYAKSKTPASLVLNGNYRISGYLIINNARDLDIGGTGTISRINASDSSGFSNKANSGIFYISDGSYNIRIANLVLSGPFSSTIPSTGTGNGIIIGRNGNQQTPTNVGAATIGVTIENNTLSGFNHSAILVQRNFYNGQLPNGSYLNWRPEMIPVTPLPPPNKSISIRHNKISNSSNGVFVYKNAESILVEHNDISNMGYDGVVFDTAAASDYNFSMPINGVRVYDNVMTDIGKMHSSAGVLIKGKIDNVVIARNTIRDVNAIYNPVYNRVAAFGISVSHDAYYSISSNVTMGGNVIDSVITDYTSGNGIFVGAGHKKITIQGNEISNIGGPCLQLWKLTETKIYGNKFSDCEYGGPGKRVYIRAWDTGPAVRPGVIEFGLNTYGGSVLPANQSWIYLIYDSLP